MELCDTTTVNIVQQITMQNEMLAVEEAMKIEVGEVKINTETAELESELSGIEQTRGPTIKCADTDETAINRSKEGHIVENWRNEFEIDNTKVKLEEDVNCEETKIEVEEVIVKHENDDLKDGNGEIAQNRIKKEQVVKDWKNDLKMQDSKVKLEEDVNYEELKIESEELIIKNENVDLNHANGEIDVNRSLEMTTVQNQHLKTKDQWTCTHCNTVFKHKLTMDDHIVRMHPNLSPDLIASGSSKLHDCTLCTYKATVKSCLDEHVSQHHKTEDSYKLKSDEGRVVKDWKNKLEMQDIKVKLEEDVNCKELKIEVEELIIKQENDYLKDANREIAVNRSLEIPSEQNQHLKTENKLRCVQCDAVFTRKSTLNGHIVRMHPHLIASVSSKIHECTHCTYKTTIKNHMDKHMPQHYKTADGYNSTETADTPKFNTCIHCNATLKSKRSLDDHMLRKHPDSIGSISTQMYECTHCAFKTVKKADFARHKLKHPETADTSKFSTCIHCNTTFKSKRSLNEHTLRKHSHSIGSISTEIHECTHCAFITVMKSHLTRHMSKHPETADTSKFSTCIHCNVTFKRKQSLDDHTLKKHPDSIASISSKVYECMHCAYKTVMKASFDYHNVSKHHETADISKFSTCIHCNTTFRSKLYLDDHTVRKHPDSIGSVSTKMYECTHCTFKTVKKTDFVRHKLKHPETADTSKFSTCIHCNAALKSKRGLDEHTLRKHPDSIGSISTKIQECTHCAFKSVTKYQLSLHMLKHHPETADSYKFSTCAYCNAAFTNEQTLDEHTTKKHPDSFRTISTKIYECTYCAFKTVQKAAFAGHKLKHPETAGFKLSTCVHCNITFKRKRSLDGHMLRKHPDSIGSISTKIYACMHCAYKTIKKVDFDYHNMSKHPEPADTSNLDEHKIHRCAYCIYQTIFKSEFARHMLKHPETADSYKLSRCAHCNATFKRKKTLDGHILREHPDSIGSISTKIHECTHCAFKTLRKHTLALHMLEHPETADSYKLSICAHCNATFKSKRSLDDHTLRKHPDSIGSISTKIYACMHCAYKTVKKADFDCHNMSRHPETADTLNLDEHKIHRCAYCTYQTIFMSKFVRHMLKHPETKDTSKFST
ncbi:unnamed protein product [Callosobruchus maculatus]|nr:unnamed protein product [Callosobruchus maculatus]